jgi:hypothetical protein
VSKIFRIHKDKFQEKCFYGISSHAHEARIVTLLNKYLSIELSILEVQNKLAIFKYEKEDTQIVLLKNIDFNLILNPKLRGVNYVLIVLTDNDAMCKNVFEGIRKLQAENEDIVYAGKIFEKNIDKKFKNGLSGLL